MRHIGNVADEQQAVRFRDYLLARGIESHIEPARSAGWDVWIEHDDQVDFGRQELEAFEVDPDHERYRKADKSAKKIRKTQEKAAERRRRNFTDVRTQQAGPFSAPVVTIGLIILCLLTAAGTQLAMKPTPLLRALLFQPYDAAVAAETVQADDSVDVLGGGSFALYSDEGMFSAIRSGQVWRLVTPMLIHWTVLHLVFNLYWLWFFGRMIEPRRNGLFFTAFILLAAILSNTAEALWATRGSFTSTDLYSAFGGFSGVNYALFGYALLLSRLRPSEGIGVDKQTSIILLGWLVLCMTGFVGPIANAAHIAGFLVGLAVAGGEVQIRRLRRAL